MMTGKVYTSLHTSTSHCISLPFDLVYDDWIVFFFSTQGHLLEDEPFLVGIGLGPSESRRGREASRHDPQPGMGTYPPWNQHIPPWEKEIHRLQKCVRNGIYVTKFHEGSGCGFNSSPLANWESC